jgi:hypothetical protein
VEDVDMVSPSSKVVIVNKAHEKDFNDLKKRVHLTALQ